MFSGFKKLQVDHDNKLARMCVLEMHKRYTAKRPTFWSRRTFCMQSETTCPRSQLMKHCCVFVKGLGHASK